MRRWPHPLGKASWIALALVACGGSDAGLDSSHTANGDDGASTLDASDAFDATTQDSGPQFPFSDGGSPSPSPPSPMSACERTCANGCCSADGICITTFTDQNCGFGGEACTTCAAGESCMGGACFRPQPDCGPSNCAGCCQGTSLCADGTDGVACGRSGEQCQRCVTAEGGGACVPEPGGGGQCGGYATCHYPNCHGCCSSVTYCALGLSQSACGSNGETCHACTGGQQCAPSANGGGECVDAGACGPQNCPGCCQGDLCAIGNQDVACGTGGAVCVDCANSAQKCGAGTCQ